MSGSAESSAFLALPTFLIGPQAGGRSYTLLKAPPAVARSAAAGDRLGDLALSLHRWSRSGEAGFVAFLPLDESQGLWTLIRGASLGASDMGQVALLRGAVLRAQDLDAIGWRAHRLAAGFEAPTYAMAGAPTNAAERFGVSAPPGAAPRGADEIARSLAHTDRLVQVPSDAEAEPLLVAVLEACGQAVRHIDGWSAGGLLQRNGRFDPADVFRLAVVPPSVGSAAPAMPLHAPARLRDGRLHGADIPAPASWAVWMGLFGAEARAPADGESPDARLAALRWRAELRQLAPEEAVRRETVAVAEGPDPVRPIAVLRRLALEAGRFADPELARAARLGLALAFGDLVRPDAATAAGQIEGWLTYVQPRLGGALPAQSALLALDTGALSHLPAATVAALTREGVMRGLFERALAFLDRGGGLDAAQSIAMLGALAEAPPDHAPGGYRELLIRLTAMLLPLAVAEAGARRATLAAIEAGDLAGDPAAADRICEPLWTLLGSIRKGDADYPRAVAIARRLAESAHRALRAPGGAAQVRLLQWAVRLTRDRAQARAA